MMRLQYRFFIVLITALSFLLSGCTPQPAGNTAQGTKLEPRGNGKRGGKLSYRVTTEPTTFNYMLAGDESTIVASFFAITSRLIDFDHQSLKFVPALAESWTMGADGRTVDVKLRENLKFSDGDALTADDIVFTLAALYDERTKSPAFRDAMLVEGKPIETRKVNDREFQLIFPKPVATAENYLVNLAVLPSHALDADFKTGKMAEAWKINSPPESIVASGPFIVSAAAPGERIEYARNPHYWKKDSAGTPMPYLDNLTIEIIKDANNSFVRLSQGSLDFADRIRATDFNEFSNTAGDVRAVDAGPGLGIDHMWFNLNAVSADGQPVGSDIKRAWFSNKGFRRAIASAVDRESIANVTLQGLATPLYGFVSPANRLWLKPDLAKIEYNLASAGEMLARAGFTKGGTAESPVLTDDQGNAVEFTLIVPAENEQRKLTAAVIQQDLGKLGIKVNVAPIETAQLTKRATESFDYDAILQGLSQTDLEPSTYQNFLLSSAKSHQWQPKQKAPATDWERRIDELFARQSVELDPARRLAAFHEIQAIMREEMPVIPIVARHVISAGNSKIGNYSPSVIFPYSMWNVDELYVK